MRIAVVSIGSFDTQYSDYHIMRDIILGLLERGHEVNLIQKQYLNIPQYPQQFDKYFGKQLRFLYKGIIINHNKNRANLH